MHMSYSSYLATLPLDAVGVMVGVNTPSVMTTLMKSLSNEIGVEQSDSKISDDSRHYGTLKLLLTCVYMFNSLGVHEY